MTATIELEEIAAHDVVNWIVLLKPGKNKWFHDSALYFGFQVTNKNNPELLKNLFNKSGDGTSPQAFSSDHLSLILGNTFMFQSDDSWQYQRIHPSMEEDIRKRLIEEYELHFFEQIAPLAKEVWQHEKSIKECIINQNSMSNS